MQEVLQEIERTDARFHWERVGIRRRRGICLPLFSARSHRDCGIGDLGDLVNLGRWCKEIGAEVIQLLPLNDLGRGACPYSAVSAFALDPVFVALDQVPGLERDAGWQARVREVASRLDGGVRIEWEAVRAAKEQLLEEALQRLDDSLLEDLLESFEEEHPWLDDYLPYRVLKDLHGHAGWEAWGPVDRLDQALQSPEGKRRRRLHLFSQWLLDAQFRRAREVLRGMGVLLEGDIPILVARDSADVWRHPEWFHLEVTAGAPPDMYSQDGQNWGFPTYRWERMEQDGHRWWRDRLRYAERYYDLYRVDHVVGFFRIWTIPAGETTGRNGFFVPGEEHRWGDHGRRILRMMLSATGMLPLAEDLGTIPEVCRETLLQMGICGFKVQRWEKRWKGDRRFIPPREYPVLSVATLSTHDSEILAQWWRDNPQERQELHEALGRTGTAPDGLTPDLHREILRWLAGGRSLFQIHLIQEILWPEGLLSGPPEEHRINVPGTVGPWNWSWRCPVSIESLLGDDERNRRILDTWNPE